jgi:hypothetical protein
MTRLWILCGSRTAAFATACLIVTGLATAFLKGTAWLGSWRMALDWGTGSLVLIGPMAAGWAALTYGILAQRGWPQFAAALPRYRRSVLDPLMLIWLAGVLALLTTTFVVLSLSSLAGSKASPQELWVVGEAAAVLAAQVAIGAALGAVLRGIWAAPVAALVVFALGPLSVLGYVPGIFDTGSVRSSLVGQTWSAAVLGWQAVSTIGIAAAGSAVLFLLYAPAHRLMGGAVVAVGGLLLVVGWSALESDGHERYSYDTSPPEWVCRGDAPTVCMDASTTRPLESLAADMRRQGEPLLELGVALPDRFDQEVPGRSPATDHGVLFFFAAADASSSIDPRSVALSLATPGACAEFHTERPPMRALRAKVVMADWISAQASESGADAYFGPSEERWLRQPPSQQQAWIVTTYRQLATCDLADVTMPF